MAASRSVTLGMGCFGCLEEKKFGGIIDFAGTDLAGSVGLMTLQDDGQRRL